MTKNEFKLLYTIGIVAPFFVAACCIGWQA